ncbi:hypothetical protein PAHAL_3G407300 [Panicum hallii]|uniref:Uncharacterized protein n=1 Tax=Panicum hallii TaxID=206008 RepID=A0A2T8KKY5_9POAL|nr:hypothetical protein PAHAL_3G407300 [Panicum hallii]
MVCLLLPKILPEHRRGMILCKKWRPLLGAPDQTEIANLGREDEDVATQLHRAAWLFQILWSFERSSFVLPFSDV